MSGRAGRRGLDSQGLCILMVDQKMSADVAKNIIKGHTDPLNSQFRLTYNMVLNLIRVPEINPHYMMERSFRYFQNKSLLPPLYESKLNF
jgi:ATP-dependent RNA helicase DOB1